MKQIAIKTIIKEIDSIKISLQIFPEQSLVVSTVYYDGLLEGVSIRIEGEEYDAWGSDDNYIYDLTMSKLGLEKA
jgi:hypothetical protein